MWEKRNRNFLTKIMTFVVDDDNIISGWMLKCYLVTQCDIHVLEFLLHLVCIFWSLDVLSPFIQKKGLDRLVQVFEGMTYTYFLLNHNIRHSIPQKFWILWHSNCDNILQFLKIWAHNSNVFSIQNICKLRKNVENAVIQNKC